jgi:hypothetical protein
MSLDEADVLFTRMPEPLAPDRVEQLAGTYESPTGFTFQVVLRGGDSLYMVFPGAPDEKLIHYKDLRFRMQKFSDLVFEFVEELGQITALKERSPAGEYVHRRK